MTIYQCSIRLAGSYNQKYKKSTFYISSLLSISFRHILSDLAKGGCVTDLFAKILTSLIWMGGLFLITNSMSKKKVVCVRVVNNGACKMLASKLKLRMTCIHFWEIWKYTSIFFSYHDNLLPCTQFFQICFTEMHHLFR